MKNIIFTATLLLLSTLAFGQKNKSALQHEDVRIINTTNINSEAIEFSPAYYLNGLVFVSSRKKNGMVDEDLGDTYFELFYADLDPNGTPLKPRSFSMEINSQLHEGPVTFNRDGDRMFFTRNNLQGTVGKPDKRGTVRLKIYQADKGYYDWENIRELPFNADNYSCMHPTLSPDGTKMFFASDKPGGFGGRDIYMSVKNNGQWSDPINLGAEINTNKDDAFPFFHESGFLFFASDGHRGYGGMDIFMVDFTTRTWGAVTNIGKPFNSPKDDLGFIMAPDSESGYLSSNRDGGVGSYDIYRFEVPYGLRTPGMTMNVQPKVNTQVVVYDANLSRRTANAVVRVFEKKNGVAENEDLYNYDLVPSPDNPADLVFKKIRKKEAELDVPKFLTDRTGQVSLQLEPNKDYIVLVSKPGFTTQEIAYTSPGMDDFQKPIEVLLEPSACITLTGVAKSTASERPVSGAFVRVRNEGTSAEETFTTKMDGSFESCLDMGYNYTITSEKLGYTKAFSEVSTVQIRGSRSIAIDLDMTPTGEEVYSGPVKKGTIIILDIFYDFDKSTIRSGEDLQLEALAKLMKRYPSMEIELIAHTDSQGEKNYNLALSLRRAESARDFLVSRGIAPERIKAFGYGEARLRNHCADGVECSEAEHQYNRRTEVLVTEIDEDVDFNFNEKK